MALVIPSLAWDNGVVQLYQGDSRYLPLEDRVVSVCVTSPPYWGLRSYLGAQDLIWGGTTECVHEWGIATWKGRRRTKPSVTVHKEGYVDAFRNGANYVDHIVDSGPASGATCRLCGAWRGAFGREPTPDMYISHLMIFMAEVWRVLRDDGVCFVNIGDSNSSGGRQTNPGTGKNVNSSLIRPGLIPGIRPKSLSLIPERFVLACQQAGWIIRDRIAWVKRSTMPESVRDRCTDSWEVIYMLTKQGRYWWDQEAVREKVGEPIRMSATFRYGGVYTGNKLQNNSNPDTTKDSHGDGPPSLNGRNLRNAWILGPEPLNAPHFAVYPSEIPRRAILAACPEAICRQCGKARVRIVERMGETTTEKVSRMGSSAYMQAYPDREVNLNYKGGHTNNIRPVTTLGWTDCGHNDYQPGLVFDPFAGSGTTLMVAQQLGRRGMGVDLSSEYVELARRRIEAVTLPMALL